MPATERVTVTLPVELIKGIDQYEQNRSRFITDAVEHELLRRKREGLLSSLQHPHPGAAQLIEMGLGDWNASLPAGDEGLVDPAAGKSVRWVEGQGWVQRVGMMVSRGTVVLVELDPTVGQLAAGELRAIDQGLELFLGLDD